MKYEWDENKRTANLARHRVDFMVAEYKGYFMTQSKLIKQEDWDAVDSPALSDEMLARMQPVQKAHPGTPPRVRGPQKAPVKTPVSIRLNPEVVDYFKAQGKGWQTRINEALTEYIINHQDS